MRIKHIDILRGIAALMVVVFHLAKNSGLNNSSFDYSAYGWTGVQIFFVISGFVLPYSLHKSAYKTHNFGTFILKRVIRIYPAYIVAIIIGITLTIMTDRELIPNVAIASHLLFLNDIVGLPSGSVVFWTLAIEFQFYLLVGVLYSYFLTTNIKSLCIIFILTALSFWIKQTCYIVAWFPFFGLGIMIFNKRFTDMSPSLFWSGVGVLTIAILNNFGIPHAISALFAMFFILYGDFNKETKMHRVLIFSGTISYSLYLIHWDLGRAAVKVTRHLPLIGNNDLLRVLIGVSFSIFCAWLLYIVVENGSAKLSAKVKYQKDI